MRKRLHNIIPFPVPQEESETYPGLIRCLLQQQYPTDTWDRLQWDETTRSRAKVFLHGKLKHFDYAKRLQIVIAALLQPIGHSAARSVGLQLVFEDFKAWRKAK